jgi:hypothetical protein
VIDKLTFFRGEAAAQTQSAEEERLMQLFQNRAGLKKAYAELQDEFHLLRDKLKQQEGATFRLQEQIEAQADLLADPGAGYGALVFYQLRGLWKQCQKLLGNFVRDLRRQQEERETQKFARAFNAERDQRLESAGAERDRGRQGVDDDAARFSALQTELSRSTAIWLFLKRRKLRKLLELQQGALARSTAELREAESVIEAIRAEPTPEFPGLSLESRRSINLAAIAYAQILCEKLSSGGLAMRAKEVVARRVQDMQFGSRAECELQMAAIQKAVAGLGAPRESAAAIKAVCDRLRASSNYRTEADTVPSADSIVGAQVESVLQGEKIFSGQKWDVLADDYWEIYSVLLR